MLNAAKARSFTDQAIAEKKERYRMTIEGEAKTACKEIREASWRGEDHCSIRISPYDLLEDVAKYLANELGYSIKLNPEEKTVDVSW